MDDNDSTDETGDREVMSAAAALAASAAVAGSARVYMLPVFVDAGADVDADVDVDVEDAADDDEGRAGDDDNSTGVRSKPCATCGVDGTSCVPDVNVSGFSV